MQYDANGGITVLFSRNVKSVFNARVLFFFLVCFYQIGCGIRCYKTHFIAPMPRPYRKLCSSLGLSPKLSKNKLG